MLSREEFYSLKTGDVIKLNRSGRVVAGDLHCQYLKVVRDVLSQHHYTRVQVKIVGYGQIDTLEHLYTRMEIERLVKRADERENN